MALGELPISKPLIFIPSRSPANIALYSSPSLKASSDVKQGIISLKLFNPKTMLELALNASTIIEMSVVDVFSKDNVIFIFNNFIYYCIILFTMRIVTTPMCESILKYAGIEDYVVNKFPDEGDGDLAILLSESKTPLISLKIKLNTFKQIRNSIKIVSNFSDSGKLSNKDVDDIFRDYDVAMKYLNTSNDLDIKVKVYSNFLKDIVEDMGFIVDDVDFDYVVFPDYLKEEVVEKDNLVEIPSHSSVSKNPIERTELRYSILEDII